MLSQCEQIKQEYEDIKSLAKEFDLEYQNTVKIGDLTKTKELKAMLEQKRDELQDKLWPFEGLKQEQLKEQYESKKNILQNLGLLEKLSNGELGITGIDGKEYIVPTYKEIRAKMKENKEIFKTKIEQGFTEIEIIPFGLPLMKLVETAKKTILKHYKEGKLFYTKKNPEDETEQLIKARLFSESDPLYFSDDFKDADIKGELVYFPEKFSEKHRGKTKAQILEETKQGFQVILREKNINIPREGKGKTIGGRHQIDTAGTPIKKYIESGETIPDPEEYLKAIQTEPMYKNEEGQTYEGWLTTFLTFLEKYNQVIDDFEGNGSGAYILGAYSPTGGVVPLACWFRSGQRADFTGSESGHRYAAYGVHDCVNVI